jgi:glycosyltransferase involved in cell wall biosynthesis
MLLSVVLPVFNEEAILQELLDRLTGVLRSCNVRWEIVFVSDGSYDSSGEILDSFADRDQRVRVVHLSRNFGHQAAVQAGLAHARGDAVVLMDSDMQDAPEAIATFLNRWREGYDVVYAVRTKRKENPVKRMLFGGFHRLLSSIASTRIPCDAGNFSLIDARVVKEIIALGERDRYLPGLRSWVGFKQIGVEVERNARYDKQPRVSLRGLWRLAKTAIYSFSSFPLTVFSWLGYTATAVFLVLSTFSLYCKLFTDLAVPGWSSAVLIASFFGAMNALGISILGEYVIRIYDQVRQRPMYVVDRSRNCPDVLAAASAATEWDSSCEDLLDQAAALLDSVKGPAMPSEFKHASFKHHTGQLSLHLED